MRRAAVLLLAVAAASWAVPAAGPAPARQPAAQVPVLYTAAVASPSPSPTTSPSPNPRPIPRSPAAFLAIIVTLAVLGAGVMVVLRARWR